MLVLLAAIVPVAESQYEYVGCYSGPPPTDLEHSERYRFQSLGRCQHQCALDNGEGWRARRQPVAGLVNGTECFCGATVPPRAQLVEESFCDRPCAGYAWNICEFGLSSVWFDSVGLGWVGFGCARFRV